MIKTTVKEIMQVTIEPFLWLDAVLLTDTELEIDGNGSVYLDGSLVGELSDEAAEKLWEGK